MFRFTQEPSSGSYNQRLAKITSLVQHCLSVQTLSVSWRHIVACCACVYIYTRTAGRVGTDVASVMAAYSDLLCVCIQGVPGGMCQTSGKCSLC